MNIGGLSSLQLLACGDDKGVLWLYKMSSWVFSAEAKKPEVLPQKVAPLGELKERLKWLKFLVLLPALFPWPEILSEEGSEEEEEAEVKPMINKVAMSPNGRFLGES